MGLANKKRGASRETGSYRHLRSPFDRSLVQLLSYVTLDLPIKPVQKSMMCGSFDEEAALEQYGISPDDFISKCKKGLLPREILFCYDAYTPNKNRDADYDWLRIIKADHEFLKSRYGLTTIINGNRLDQNLRKLVRMQVLTKKNKRYMIGPAFLHNPRSLNNIQEIVKGASQEESWSNGIVTLIGLNTKDRAFVKTNRELEEFVGSCFKEAVEEICQRFRQERLWESGTLEFMGERIKLPLDVAKKKPGSYGRLPLIVIDPNRYTPPRERLLFGIEAARAFGDSRSHSNAMRLLSLHDEIEKRSKAAEKNGEEFVEFEMSYK